MFGKPKPQEWQIVRDGYHPLMPFVVMHWDEPVVRFNSYDEAAHFIAQRQYLKQAALGRFGIRP